MEDNPFDIHSLPKCDNLFELAQEIGSGVTSKVFLATEKRSGRNLAVKILKLTEENKEFVKEECRILTHLPKHDNIVDVYGIYIREENNQEEVWIVMEKCLGTAIDFVRRMQQKERKLDDSYLSYILNGLIRAIIHLHKNNVIHRDIKGSNILITADGEIRLADFGISCVLNNAEDKANLRIGSPSWMAPEMVTPRCAYDNRVDVWAMGITAMELMDGKAPFEEMHPTNALFQISKNPPPGLILTSNRSQILNDFINECLEKNPENRPVIHEFLEHPLLQANQNIHNVRSVILEIMKEENKIQEKKVPEILIKESVMKVENSQEEKILYDDLAMLESVTEEALLVELEERFKKKNFHTFIGDILLVLNPNEENDIYGQKYHEKYRFKARSDNVPHIYSVADTAYQDALHHEEPQQILITGESMSGKTTNMLHLLDHLLFLGQGNKCGESVRKAMSVIQSLGNAGTQINPNSTRNILQTQISFTETGKTSGAIFWIYQLEKNRVASTDRNIRNFHIFYYFFNALQSENKLQKYFLEREKSYEFLKNDTNLNKRWKSAKECADEFSKFEKNLKDIGFDEGQLKSIRRVLAAILVLGEIEFGTDSDGNAKLNTQNEADAVAELLGLEEKKFSWALLKYCVIMKGEATMRYHTETEAMETRDVLARGLYFRLVDWIINCINEKLSIPRAIYGDKHTVNVLDLFGFECFNTNTIDQLIINSMNEQLQFYYNQKIFSWEMKNAEEEEITVPDLQFHDNRMVMDQLLSKPNGLMHLIDETTKSGEFSRFTENLKNLKNSHISVVKENEFSIAHYTGKVTYKASEVLNRNRDFLPPEMIETMRRSSNDNVRKLFTGLLTTTGNLTMHSDSDKMDNREGRWNTGFSSTNIKFRGRKYNTSSKGQYSQSRQMRTTATTFRATCLELLRSLASNENNKHFVKCIRSNLFNSPSEFQRDIIRQQVKAFGGLETVQARQKGYSCSITFSDFIRRYKFLAFDFNETVEETKENCRLLLIRLKMESWIIGKTKVCLKYCDKEYLSRLYGINVRKIVKVQSMTRAFLARRNLRAKIKRYQEDLDQCVPIKDVHSAVNNNGQHERETDLDGKIINFIKPWFRKWKLQSIYQILLLYRSKQERNLVYFCQQVHLYNQNDRSLLEGINQEVNIEKVDANADSRSIFPKEKISVHKIPFTLKDITFFDSSQLCSKVDNKRNLVSKDFDLDEEWDAPLKSIFPTPTPQQTLQNKHDKECQTDFCQNTIINLTESENNSSATRPCPDEVTITATDISKKCNNTKSHETSPENQEILNRSPKKEDNRKRPKYIGAEPGKNSYLNELNYCMNNNTNKFGITGSTYQTESKNKLPQYKSPIREMEEKFKTREKSYNDDDPPYNFRALLRKTNYSDMYQKKAVQEINNYDFTLRKQTKKIEEPTMKRQISCTEIAPGLIIEGEITDL